MPVGHHAAVQREQQDRKRRPRRHHSDHERAVGQLQREPPLTPPTASTCRSATASARPRRSGSSGDLQRPERIGLGWRACAARGKCIRVPGVLFSYALPHLLQVQPGDGRRGRSSGAPGQDGRLSAPVRLRGRREFQSVLGDDRRGRRPLRRMHCARRSSTR